MSHEREACVVLFPALDVVCTVVCRMDFCGPHTRAKRRGRDLFPSPRPVGRARGLCTRVRWFDPHLFHPSKRCVTSAITGHTSSTAIDVRSTGRLSRQACLPRFSPVVPEINSCRVYVSPPTTVLADEGDGRRLRRQCYDKDRRSDVPRLGRTRRIV